MCTCVCVCVYHQEANGKHADRHTRKHGGLHTDTHERVKLAKKMRENKDKQGEMKRRGERGGWRMGFLGLKKFSHGLRIGGILYTKDCEAQKSGATAQAKRWNATDCICREADYFTLLFFLIVVLLFGAERATSWWG